MKATQETQDVDTQVTPDIDELLQTDEPPAMSTVPVRVTEAVTIWRLPNRRVRIDEIPVDDVSWQTAITDSKKRSRAVLIGYAVAPSTATGMRIRVSTSGNGQAWPLGVPYPIEHMQQVQVLSNTAGQIVTVGVTEEFWAD